MREALVYSEGYFNGDDQQLGWVDAAISAGTALVGSLFNRGGSSQQYRGSAGINSAGQQAIASLQQILSAVSSNPPAMPLDQAVSEAQRIASALSNSQFVYQAQHGSDAAALQRFKDQAAELVRQIQARAAAPSGSILGDPPTGSGSTVSSSSGLGTGTILLVFGALAAVALLRR